MEVARSDCFKEQKSMSTTLRPAPQRTDNFEDVIGLPPGAHLASGPSGTSPSDHRSKIDPGPTRDDLRPNWGAIIWLTLVHIGALGAFFTFHWSVIPLVIVLHWITGSLGICLGYHRLLTHGSFSTYPWMRGVVSVLGSLAGEGAPLDWVATHRQHHALSDQPGDPHSPHDGPWWAHMFWLAWGYHGEAQQRFWKRWAPDLLKDPVVVAVSRWFLPWNILMAVTLLLTGAALGGWSLGVSWLVWGMFVRLVAVLHTTWLVNSASHMWGYRNYETTDDSRNLWWVGLIAHGEGWHNNHHAYPRMAAHGHRWWEFDVTYAAICLLEKCGLAWDVVHHQRGVLKTESAAAAGEASQHRAAG
jgi:stearoyl-CoA desaturase (delta-9 desaturase)